MEYVGKVSKDDVSEIQKLFNRKQSLDELKLIVDNEKDPLFQKLTDACELNQKFYTQWWSDMTRKYHWERFNGQKLTIKFDTCVVQTID